MFWYHFDLHFKFRDHSVSTILVSDYFCFALSILIFSFAFSILRYFDLQFCSETSFILSMLCWICSEFLSTAIPFCSLTGVSPFYAESARQTLLKIQGGKAEFPSEIFAEISEVAQEFISKLLEKDPRYVTCHLTASVCELWLEMQMPGAET